MLDNQLDDLGYISNKPTDPLDKWCLIYEKVERTIPSGISQVLLSQEIVLRAKYSTLLPVIDEIKNKMLAGEDISAYQSKSAEKFEYHDRLLNHWGIYHLHLNPISTLKNGYVKRADDLLFLRIEGNTAYLIDIRDHSEINVWEQRELIEYVDNNWPDLHFTINGDLVKKTLNPTQRATLRQKNVNSYESISGKTIMAKLGVMSNGSPIDAIMRYQHGQRELQYLETYARENFGKLFPKIKSRITAHLRLMEMSGDYYTVKELHTNSEVKIHRLFNQ